MNDFIQFNFVKMNIYPERKVMEYRNNNFFSLVVVNHICLDYFYWKFVFGWNAEDFDWLANNISES